MLEFYYKPLAGTDVAYIYGVERCVCLREKRVILSDDIRYFETVRKAI